MVDRHPSLIEVVRQRLLLRRYSLRTEQVYVHWIRRFIRFAAPRHPRELREPDIEAFLSWLAVEERVSASAQSQAFSALLFLYRHVLELELTGRIQALRPRRPRRLPTVLSQSEVARLMEHLRGTPRLIVEMLYGSGLRLQEFLNLRIQDIDFDCGCIRVVHGKGGKDRTTLLPASLRDRLRAHIQRVQALHAEDLARGLGQAFLPDALGRKYTAMGQSFAWQFLFPSTDIFSDARTGNTGRWHIHERTVAKILQAASRRAGLVKRVTSHTLRHSFATHLMETGVNLRVIQALLGHAHPETTMIYTHVSLHHIPTIRSPLDAWSAKDEPLRPLVEPSDLPGFR